MNTADTARMLRRLEPPVRPIGDRGPAGGVQSSSSAQGFGSMLALVAHGSYSGNGLLRCDCDLEPGLSEGQQERLAAAADDAAREGVERALMLIDGRSVVVDIANRALESEVGSQVENQIVKDVDAAVYVADDDAIARPQGPVALNGAAIPTAVMEEFARAGVLDTPHEPQKHAQDGAA